MPWLRGQPSEEPGELAMEIIATSVALTQAASREPVQPTQQEGITPTATVTEVPVMATVSIKANCRSGPAGSFEVILVIPPGEGGRAIGQNLAVKPWYQLELADGTLCWVAGDALTLSGDTSGIPEVVSPPTPTPKPAPSWAGTWHLWFAYGRGTSNIQEPVTKFTQMGDKVTFQAIMVGGTFVFTGTSSPDGLRLSGMFEMVGGTTTGHTFLFVRDASNLDQFGGQFHFKGGEEDGDFCGAKPGLPKPDPCRR